MAIATIADKCVACVMAFGVTCIAAKVERNTVGLNPHSFVLEKAGLPVDRRLLWNRWKRKVTANIRKETPKEPLNQVIHVRGLGQLQRVAWVVSRQDVEDDFPAIYPSGKTVGRAREKLVVRSEPSPERDGRPHLRRRPSPRSRLERHCRASPRVRLPASSRRMSG